MKLFSIWLALVARATAEEAQSLQDVLPYLKVDLGLILVFLTLALKIESICHVTRLLLVFIPF